MSGTSFNISAAVSDLDTELGSLSIVDVNISDVQARIFTRENRTLIDTVELTDPEGDWTYEGVFTGTVDGDYVIDIEVEDTNSTLVIEREIASFTVGEELTTTTTTETTGSIPDPLTIGMVSIGGIMVVIVAVYMLKKRS